MKRSAWLLAALLAAQVSLVPVVRAHDHHDHQEAAEPAWQNRWEGLKPTFPEIVVVDQEGRKLNFYADLVKGKTVAINFIYTNCTTVCSPLTATFRRVQRSLVASGAGDVQMISVSVDPRNDTPQVLKKFAAKFDVGPGWSFVTGSKRDIDRLLKAVGAYSAKKADHSPVILIGNDATGKWTRTFGFAPADAIAASIRQTAGAADAPQPASSGRKQVAAGGA